MPNPCAIELAVQPAATELAVDCSELLMTELAVEITLLAVALAEFESSLALPAQTNAIVEVPTEAPVAAKPNVWTTPSELT
jgi:hypothetical protein